MVQNEKRIIIVTTLVVTLLAGTLGTLTYFKYAECSEYKDVITKKKTEKLLAENKKKLIPVKKQELKKLSEQVEHYVKILPTKDEMAQDAFAYTMQQFANNANIQIIRADPIKRRVSDKDKGEQSDFIKQSYHFMLTGTFRNFLIFLHKVENWHRFLVVEEIGIKPYEDAQGSPAAGKSDITMAKKSEKSIELVLTTYIYAPVSGKSSAAAAPNGQANAPNGQKKA